MTDKHLEEYTVEIIVTRTVLAYSQDEAAQRVLSETGPDDACVYVDGCLWS